MIEGGKRELRRKQPWRRNTGAAPTTLPENAAAEVACEIAREEETVARERERERERVAVEPPESNSGRRWWCMAGERGGGR